MPEKNKRDNPKSMPFIIWFLAGFLVTGAFMATTVQAQMPGIETEEAAPAEEPVVDPYNRQTPRSMATAFVNAIAAEDYARAANYLDIPDEERAKRGAQLAKQLQRQLDKGGSLDPFAILSNEATGTVDDGLAPEQERIGSLNVDGADVPIIAVHSDIEGMPIWLISANTLAALPQNDEYPAAEENIAEEVSTLETSFAGAPLIDWIKLIVLALLIFGALRLLLALPVWITKRLSHDPETNKVYGFIKAAAAPLSLYLSVLFFFQIAQQLEVAIVARQALTRYAGIVGWVAFAWFVWRIINFISQLATNRMNNSGRMRAASLVVFARRAIKILLAVVAAIAILDTLGLDVTTGIAALGIGGLALALGAQKTIENVVGSLTVIIDQPIRVGDFCKVGDVTGTVEDIGMRSTRIRTNDRTVVAIPNGDFAARQIENYSQRDSFLFDPTIGITYDADSGTVKKILEAIRKLLDEENTIINEGSRVRFFAFGSSSLDIEIFAHMRAQDYAHSLEISERLMLNIMDKVTECGADFAFPTRTVHIAPQNTEI